MRRGRTKAGAISLFDEIPVGRTCQSAGVAVHWCMCTYVEPVPHSTVLDAAGEWRATAEWVVDHINELLRRSDITARLCQPLALMHVIDAVNVLPTDLVRTMHHSLRACLHQRTCHLVLLLLLQ